MRKLLIASALAVGLSFPAVSQAQVSAFGVDLPVGQSEVSDNIHGGYVAQNLSDTLRIQKLHGTDKSKSNNKSYGESYYVFGVDLNSTNQI